MVVPGTVPFVQGVYEGYPADLAGMQPGTVILAIDGVPVANTTDISTLLAETIPGQTIQVLGEDDPRSDNSGTWRVQRRAADV